MGMSKVKFWASFDMNLAGTFKAEILVSAKTQCLFAIGGDKRVRFLELTSLKLVLPCFHS